MAATLQIGDQGMQFKQQVGFTFIGLLIIISISGILLSVVGIVWKQDAMRTKEAELLYLGNVYQEAIKSYYENTPGGGKTYPQTLEQLVLDKRFPGIKRHIRQLYPNPMSEDHTWQVVKQQGRIIGVTTASSLKPIKQANFDEAYMHFATANSYEDWTFSYTPQGNNARPSELAPAAANP